MRTVYYKCEDYPNNSICAELIVEEHKLTGCIGVTMKHYADEDTVYLTREDALHLAETIKELATS